MLFRIDARAPAEVLHGQEGSVPDLIAAIHGIGFVTREFSDPSTPARGYATDADADADLDPEFSDLAPVKVNRVPA